MHEIHPPRQRRSGCALLLALLANAALALELALRAPPSRWHPAALVACLVAFGVVGCFNSVKLTPQTYLNAEFVAALLAVVLLGPLPAICVWLAGEVMYLVLLPGRIQAHLANVASYAWAAFAGALLLQALEPGGVSGGFDPAAWLAVALVGVVMLCVNFAIAIGIVEIVLDRGPVVALIKQELLARAPAALLMIVTGTVIAFLYLAIGIPALAVFSATVALPRIARTPLLAR